MENENEGKINTIIDTSNSKQMAAKKRKKYLVVIRKKIPL